MAALSLRGYCRTVSVRIAWIPAMRITRFTTSASTGRRMKMSVKDFTSTIGRSRRLGTLRRQLVVLDHGHAIAQFEDAGTDDALACLEARFDAQKITLHPPGADELLAHGKPRLARPGGGFDHIDRLAVGRAEHRSGGDRQHFLLFG